MNLYKRAKATVNLAISLFIVAFSILMLATVSMELITYGVYGSIQRYGTINATAIAVLSGTAILALLAFTLISIGSLLTILFPIHFERYIKTYHETWIKRMQERNIQELLRKPARARAYYRFKQ